MMNWNRPKWNDSRNAGRTPFAWSSDPATRHTAKASIAMLTAMRKISRIGIGLRAQFYRERATRRGVARGYSGWREARLASYLLLHARNSRRTDPPRNSRTIEFSGTRPASTGRNHSRNASNRLASMYSGVP